MSNTRQNLKFVTISFIFIFFLSVFTFYWIVTSPLITLNGDPDRSEPLGLVPISNPNIGISGSDGSRLSAEIKLDAPQPQLQSQYSQRDYPNPDLDTPVTQLDLDTKSTNFRISQLENENQERIDRVHRLCESYHLGRYKWPNNGSNDLDFKEPPTPLYSYFFWNRQRHLAWCPVYKAGSTSWLYNMMILAGYSEQELDNPPKQLSIMARDAYGDAEPDKETLEQSLKLLVVRHPFERLVSAYKDKLSNASIGHEHGTFHFYKKYGKKIVQKFRKDKTSKQMEPTWEELILYLLSTDLLQYSDDHWLPAYYSCTPCLVDYDIIAKVETYNSDQEYIIYKAGLEGILKPRWNHKTTTKQRDRDTLTKKYFSQLTKSQITKLYQKYWFDFELFGYDYKEFLKFGMDDWVLDF